MPSIEVKAGLNDVPVQHHAAWQRLQTVSRWLDSAITIPFTRIKLGLDAVIGLIPGVGDAAGLLIGGWLIWEAHRMGTPADIKWKMARNVAIDAVSGFVPVLGDAVDVMYRSNARNMELLQQYHAPGMRIRRQRSHWGLKLLVTFTLIAGSYCIWKLL